MLEEEYLCINREVRREEAHPLLTSELRGLDPIKLAYSMPVSG